MKKTNLPLEIAPAKLIYFLLLAMEYSNIKGLYTGELNEIIETLRKIAWDYDTTLLIDEKPF